MRTPRQKRRRYIVKKGLQFRYTALILACMSATVMIAGALFYVEIWNAVIPEFSEARLAEKLEIASQLRGYEEARSGQPEARSLSLLREAQLLSAHERAAVSRVLRAANARLVPKLLILVAVIALAGLILSHRLAGPLYRLGKSVQAVSEGDLTVRFTLRKHDELKDLASALEALVRLLRGKIHQTLTSVRGMSHALDQASALAGDHPELGRYLAVLKARTGELERELSVFKLE